MDVRRIHFRRAVIAVALSLVAALGLACVAPPADAVRIIKTTGRPGFVDMPRAVGIRTDTISGNAIYVPSRRIGESPAAKKLWQRVCVRTNLFSSSAGSGWQFESAQRSCRAISARATQVRIPGPRFTDLLGFNSFIYSITVDVTWQLKSGKTIGRRLIDYSAKPDYRCVGDCQVGLTRWGGGAYVTFPNF